MTHKKIPGPINFLGTTVIIALFLSMSSSVWSAGPIRPFSVTHEKSAETNYLTVQMEAGTFLELTAVDQKVLIAFPTPDGDELILEMEPFTVITENTRAMVEDRPMKLPEVVVLRGNIAGRPGTHAFLAVTKQGSANGYVTNEAGTNYYLAHAASEIAAGRFGEFTIIDETDFYGEAPDEVPFCGFDLEKVQTELKPGAADKISDPLYGGSRLAEVALDCDPEYCNLFGGDLDAAAAFVATLVAAISDIYQRDFNFHVVIKLLRFWPLETYEFEAGDLDGYAAYWYENDHPEEYNMIALLSGRRDLIYGGFSYHTGICSGNAFTYEGYLNGSFPSPVSYPILGNRDIIVLAHEWGHNFGSEHTHSGTFDPPIDSCTRSFWMRGTLMSYCHVNPGHSQNVDLRFHRRIVEVVENEWLAGVDCYAMDCNLNGIADSSDILSGFSFDINSNLVPDECEDCNNNGIFDVDDIAGGMPDVNGNGLPDECEYDCNANGYPDEYEVSLGLADDANGDNIPDECQPDCDGNGVFDFTDILEKTYTDYDINMVPDICQDCNGNGRPDWEDIQKPQFVYISNYAYNMIREYHYSGYPTDYFTSPLLDVPGPLEFGPDRQLYIVNFGNNNILKLDIETRSISVFIPAGTAGLGTPSEIAFLPDGRMLVADYGNRRIMSFNSVTGSYLGDFVASGSGGLQYPNTLELGPNGNLFVASSDNNILEYSGIDGSFIRVFIPASNYHDDPISMTFMSNGDLLIIGRTHNLIARYDGTTGNFVYMFNNDIEFYNSGEIRLGPDGHIFLVNGPPRNMVFEFKQDVQQYFECRLRGDTMMASMFGLAFRPPSAYDLNRNELPDQCDIDFGLLTDSNQNGIPDEYESEDIDGDGVANAGDNCPLYFNPSQQDSDLDGIGDPCDNCPATNNPDQLDSDGDDVGDLCDNCLYTTNPDQVNSDGDSLGDLCDNCDLAANDDQVDGDHDGYGDACDLCPGYDDQFDNDGDGIPDDCDICPGYSDRSDGDEDNVPDSCDNCPEVFNPDQADGNQNDVGDACDIICGNANSDEQVNVGDAVFLISYIFRGGAAPEPTGAGDANCDGEVNVGDAVYLISYVFKGGSAPCCP